MKISISIAAISCVAIVSVALTGCFGDSYVGAKLVPCEGVLTLDGNPVGGATITMTNSISTSSAITADDGTFAMQTAQGPMAFDGVLPSSYKVLVKKFEEIDSGITEPPEDASEDEKMAYEEQMSLGQSDMVPNSLIPERYGDSAKSDLNVNLTDGGKTDIKLEMIGG